MRSALVLTLVIFVGAFAQAVAADAPLRVGFVQALANAPVLIAERKGFFTAENLNVELKSFSDGPLIQQAIASGAIDVAYIGIPPVYQWFARGLPVRILAKVNYGQAALIARSDGAIHTLADLKGRHVAGPARGSGMDVLLRGFVLKEAAKLDPDADLSLSQMPVGNMEAALRRGTIDAAFAWEPFVSQSVLRGSGRVILDVNAALPNYPWYVIAAPETTLTRQPDTIVKLLRAHAKAVAFLQDCPAEANQVIAEAFQLGFLTSSNGTRVAPEDVAAAARQRLGWSAQITQSDRAFIQRLIDYSTALGFLNKPVKADDFIDTDFLARATHAQP